MSDGWDYKDAERLAQSWADEAEEKAQARIAELERQLKLVTHERDFLHGESKLLEGQRDEARRTARRYFRWINDDESPDTEHTEVELAKYPWLKE